MHRDTDLDDAWALARAAVTDRLGAGEMLGRLALSATPEQWQRLAIRWAQLIAWAVAAGDVDALNARVEAYQADREGGVS